MKACPVNLRERVAAAVLEYGLTWADAARRFRLSVASVDRFVHARRTGQELIPRLRLPGLLLLVAPMHEKSLFALPVLLAGVALLLTAIPERADQPLGDKREDAAHATGKGVNGSPTGVKLAVTERNVSVRLLKGRVDMPTRVRAGEVSFALVNAGNQLRGFKISGPGLERALPAPLPPRQTATMAVNLQPGVYVVEAPAQGGSAKRLRVELTAVEQ